MKKTTVTVNDETYEFDSIEEAHKAFPAFIDLEEDMNKVFDETDKVFSAMDDVFDRVGEVFKKYRKVKIKKKTNRRVDIKALLKDPIKKAKLIANAVRSSRFFK